MPKHLLVFLPVPNEPGFHVEHTPIEKPPASAGSFFDQSMNLGVNDLHRQRRGEFGQGGDPLAPEPRAQAFLRPLDPEGHAPIRHLCLAEDDHALGARADQMIEPPRSERTSAA